MNRPLTQSALNAPARLALMLADGRAVNMVLTAQSRTGKVRSYRLFAVDPSDHRTIDITSDVCRTIGVEWNRKTGTFDSKGYRTQDHHELASRLSRALGSDTLLPVLIL